MKSNKRRNSALPYILVGALSMGVLIAIVAFLVLGVGEHTGAAEADRVQDEQSVEIKATENVNAANQVSDEGNSEKTSEDNLSAEDIQDGSMTENSEPMQNADSENVSDESADEVQITDEAQSEVEQQSTEEAQNSEGLNGDENTENSEAMQTDENTQTAESTQAQEQTASKTPSPVTGGHLVVIDPGHQSKGMSEKEPNGPGSSQMKAKVTGGTSGRTTGLTEYQLNLSVGLKLRDELVRRGYNVIMTRESNDVSLSNVDRAQIANNAGAEAFVRIHANGSDNTDTNGAMTICQTPSNPYNSSYYSASRKLSDCVLDSFVAATGCKKQYVWETDTMTGINWANVPSTIIEMGYMTNPTEDTNMANDDYQNKMAIGIANGIDAFFAN